MVTPKCVLFSKVLLLRPLCFQILVSVLFLRTYHDGEAHKPLLPPLIIIIVFAVRFIIIAAVVSAIIITISVMPSTTFTIIIIIIIIIITITITIVVIILSLRILLLLLLTISTVSITHFFHHAAMLNMPAVIIVTIIYLADCRHPHNHQPVSDLQDMMGLLLDLKANRHDRSKRCVAKQPDCLPRSSIAVASTP